MKKRTKILAGLVAAVLLLSAVGFGFSQWSSNINLTGNISAHGNWDVAISNASIKSISSATTVDGELSDVPATVTVTAYNVYADYCTDFNPNWKEYRMHIDDVHPITLELTQAELAEFTARSFIPGNIMAGYNNYESGKKGVNIQYMVKLNETAEAIGWEAGRIYCDSEDSSFDGKLMGVAIGEHIAGVNNSRNNPWGIQIVYNDAVAALEGILADTTVTVTVYDVYAQLFTAAGNDPYTCYRMKFDDLNAREVEISLADLAAYNEGYMVTQKNPIGLYWLTSGLKAGTVGFMVNLNDLGVELGFKGEATTNGKMVDEVEGNQEGKLIGTALISHIANNRDNTAGLVETYTAASEQLAAGPMQGVYAAAISEDGLTATYNDVALTLPGAWAQYTVTVTNNGTANANLSNYRLEVAGADGVITVAAPELPAGEVLLPGESCTVTFVAGVPADYAEPVLNADGVLSVNLVYVQDAVEPAPAAAHIH